MALVHLLTYSIVCAPSLSSFLSPSVIRERKKRQAVEKRLREMEKATGELVRHYDSCLIQVVKEVLTPLHNAAVMYRRIRGGILNTKIPQTSFDVIRSPQYCCPSWLRPRSPH